VATDRYRSAGDSIARHQDDEGGGVLVVEPAGMNTILAARRLTASASKRIPAAAVSRHAGIAGQSLIEFALLLPLIFLLILNLVNFGGFFFAWITVSNGARAGAQYMSMGTATVGDSPAATPAQVTALVTNDISSLLNRASLVVRVCTNNNGTITCTGGGAQTPPADPEPSYYILTSVDVTYTYVPFISAWNFNGLGIHLTLPATTIHQRAVMRRQQ
jgi:Flp pilus assembly protein TadG